MKDYTHKQYSGIYPHLAVTNQSDTECGIGAVVAWYGKLYYLTYPANEAKGSNDKLYILDEKLNVDSFQGSVGGTHANRMVHRESNQLIIGLYFIDCNGGIRSISPELVQGRMTAVARHLTDPANKVYFFSMEEGLYEVDVNTLQVNTLLEDQLFKNLRLVLPGVHGKGAYAGQKRFVIAKNGIGGSLAEWDGNGKPGEPASWNIVDANKYTDITGPDGIYGSPDDTSPLWALGWDHKSVLLNVCEGGNWHRYRLPKASYAYDADHGWYTEWPRIRSIGRQKLLMDMHGMFYEFPGSYSVNNSSGIKPISRHLKMVVDFTDWNGKLVMAANDASVMENPLNLCAQSNLWFGSFDDLPKMGKPSGWGGVWVNENIQAHDPSEPFMCYGFDRRVVHISHDSDEAVTFIIEIDEAGTNNWNVYTSVEVPSHGYAYTIIPENINAQWIRLKADRNAACVTAYFHYSCSDTTYTEPEMFNSLALGNEVRSEGIIRPMADDMTLQFAADIVDGEGNITGSGYYEIGEDMILRCVNQPSIEHELRNTASTTQDYELDDASVIIYDEAGKRYRLPKGADIPDNNSRSVWRRGIREVVTERNLMNVCGTFYELPRESSGGLSKVKPICTHNRAIYDFASWRGMLVLSGNAGNIASDDHYVSSDDNRAGLWFGNVDDLWKMGSPKGEGGPCYNSALKANHPSDPYLMTGYDHKTVRLSHDRSEDVEFIIEIDYMADDTWHIYNTIMVPAGQEIIHTFPEGFNAHWVRVKVNLDCKATAWFSY